jgi:hypothetical protein
MILHYRNKYTIQKSAYFATVPLPELDVLVVVEPAVVVVAPVPVEVPAAANWAFTKVRAAWPYSVP